jgi:hypothetical protein
MPLHDFIDLYVRLRHPHHYELQSWPLALWLSVLWPMPIAFVWLKRERRQNHSRALAELARISFVLAALILIAIIGAGIWDLSESLVQMSLYRFTIYLQLFACIATALLVEQTKREMFTTSTLALLSALLLVVVAFISKSPIIASRQVPIIILAVAFALLAAWRVLPRAINLILACLLLVTAIATPKASGVIRWVQQDDSDYLEVCDWARTHTPIEAIFLTPPNETEMRLRGQRAIIVNYKCVPQLSSGLKQWRDRLQDVLDLPSLLVLPRGMLNTENAIAQRYSSLAGEHLVKVAKQYGARYVVATHRLGNLPDLAMVYPSSTGRYLVYDLAREQRKEAQVSPEEIQRAMLDRFAIRVQPAMSQYILDHLNQKTQTEIPVMGSHARTGVPVRQHIPLGALQQQTPAVSPGA